MPNGLHAGALIGLMLWPQSVLGDEMTADRARELTNLVRHDCGSCHGLTLQGGLGRPITAEALTGVDDATVGAIILDGLPGTAMPPWRGLINDDEAAWIADGLKQGRFQCSDSC